MGNCIESSNLSLSAMEKRLYYKVLAIISGMENSGVFSYDFLQKSHMRDHILHMRSSYPPFFVSNLQKSGHGEFANTTRISSRTAVFVLCQIIFLKKSLEKTIPVASGIRTFETNALILQAISTFSSILCMSWHIYYNELINKEMSTTYRHSECLTKFCRVRVFLNQLIVC